MAEKLPDLVTPEEGTLVLVFAAGGGGGAGGGAGGGGGVRHGAEVPSWAKPGLFVLFLEFCCFFFLLFLALQVVNDLPFVNSSLFSWGWV